ncbi:hypothetical protein ACFWPV_36975 [Streptomyces uncialis]|uniref:hypothetical protein n=1 Tax=Streptomyces uncialis TaxID=1048205 RepID=UPI003665C86E
MLSEAAEFKALAVSRLAAQHAEIEQLRETAAANARVKLCRTSDSFVMLCFGSVAVL